MKHLLQLLCLLGAPLLVSAQHQHGASSAPAAPSSGPEIRSLDVYVADNALHLLVAASTPASPRVELQHLVSTDAGATWSAPARVNLDGPAPLARGRGTDFPLAVTGTRATAIWLTLGSGHGGRGPLASAYSADRGAQWSTAPSPADDGTDGDHAFIDVTATPDGTFHAVWLDSRMGKGKALVTAASRDGGQSWSPNRIIDQQTCECCWNVLQPDSAGQLYCLYRNVAPRDMGLATSRDNGQTWQSLPAPGAFGWDFNGCPHVGGALAIQGAGDQAKLHALVWTGKDTDAGLYYTQAAAPAYQWSQPQRMGSARARLSDLAMTADGNLLACWNEAVEEGTQLLVSLSTDGGQTWSKAQSIAEPKRRPTHPRVVAAGNLFHVFWTEKSDNGTTWRHASLPADAPQLAASPTTAAITAK